MLFRSESIGRPPVRLRLSWHLADENTLTWRNEVSIQGAPFNLIERYLCTPIE